MHGFEMRWLHNASEMAGITSNLRGFIMAFKLRVACGNHWLPMKDITDASNKKIALASRDCKPGENGVGRLKAPMIRAMMKQLPGKWKLVAGRRLERSFKFPDFQIALAFTNRLGEIAEEQGHHPDVYLAYGEVRVQLSTHSAKGLTENDFILAAKINGLK
jgi:4a-hydroxytetrahydrobiopterin dehydratase